MVANSSSRAQQHTYMEMYLHTFWAVHCPLSLPNICQNLYHFPISWCIPLSLPKHFTELVCIFPLACGQEHQIYINVRFSMYLHTFWAVHSPLSPQHLTELVIIFQLAGAFPSLSQTFHRTCLHFPISLWTRTSNLHQCA